MLQTILFLAFELLLTPRIQCVETSAAKKAEWNEKIKGDAHLQDKNHKPVLFERRRSLPGAP